MKQIDRRRANVHADAIFIYIKAQLLKYSQSSLTGHPRDRKSFSNYPMAELSTVQ